MDKVKLTFEHDAGPDVWQVRRARLEERLSSLYVLVVDLRSEGRDAEPAQLLGKPVRLVAERGAITRAVPGIVAELVEGAVEVDHVTAQLVVRPALEALRHRRDTRLFQNKTVPEILDEVLAAGLGPFERSVEARLRRTYPTCEYLVQYDESDLDFCQRLMEEEGITYFFETEGAAETLVLSDEIGALGEVAAAHGSPVEIIMRQGDDVGHEHIFALDPRSSLRPTKLATRHFDWTHPDAPIEGASSDPAPADYPGGAHVGPEREIYEHDHHELTLSEYGGNAYGANDVEDQVRIRRESHSYDARVVEGRSTVLGMRTGATLETVGHRAPELDRRYVVLSASHSFSWEEAGDSGDRDPYTNTFHCIPDDVVYRPERKTRRPRVDGTQTAIVVGPAGEEIHTDEHARIRVQFHWDRHGEADERSTRWVRVMQPWAGSGWGFVFIPRIGMEVLVEFVDGDPDRPLVMGAVYNGDNPLPYSLPADKTKSTIKTQSSLGGDGYNELRFEDLAGSEQIFIHAQKDFNEVVENDHTTTVHHDQTIRVDNNQLQEIGNDQTEHVFVNQDLTVDANRDVTVHADYSETIDGSETRTVSSSVTETIDAGETRTVTGGMTETISGGRTQTINAGSTESISGSLTQTVTGGITITTPGAYEITAAGGFSLTTPAATTFIAPGGYTLLAPGGQTSVDESWFSMGNSFYDNYSVSMSAAVTDIAIVLVVNISTVFGASTEVAGLKATAGGAFEEFSGAKMKTGASRLKHLGLTIITAGLWNET